MPAVVDVLGGEGVPRPGRPTGSCDRHAEARRSISTSLINPKGDDVGGVRPGSSMTRSMPSTSHAAPASRR